jgi:predicted DNA-binding transcriptional regulator YafY
MRQACFRILRDRGQVLTTSARLLRLLSILQAPGPHTGPSLAARLEISTRSVRNDVAALRELGYPVHGGPGPSGGYTLGSGAALPPLLLDDDEAVAVAVGLGLATTGAVQGIEEASVTALGKLEQVLPSRLRYRVDVLASSTEFAHRSSQPVDGATLQTIAEACRSTVRLRFEYRSSRRDVEPYRLVHRAGRWYLVGWDTDRQDWRTFRVDRMALRVPNGPRFRPRPAPSDVAAFVDARVGVATWAFRARVRLHASVADIVARAPAAVSVTAETDRTCLVDVGSDDAASLARYLAMWAVDFDVIDSPALADEVRLLARRYARATHSTGGGEP